MFDAASRPARKTLKRPFHFPAASLPAYKKSWQTVGNTLFLTRTHKKRMMMSSKTANDDVEKQHHPLLHDDRPAAPTSSSSVCFPPLALFLLFAVFLSLNSCSAIPREPPNPITNWALYPLAPATSSEEDIIQWIFSHIKTTTSPLYAHVGSASAPPKLPAPWSLTIDIADTTPSSWATDKFEHETRVDYVSVSLQSDECLAFHELACTAGIRPRALGVDFNAYLPLDSTLGNMKWSAAKNGDIYTQQNRDRLFGCGLGALQVIAEECAYSIVNVVGDKAFFVADEDLNSVKKLPVEYWHLSAGLPIGQASNQDRAYEFLCDFKLWLLQGEDQCRSRQVLDAQINALGLNF